MNALPHTRTRAPTRASTGMMKRAQCLTLTSHWQLLNTRGKGVTGLGIYCAGCVGDGRILEELRSTMKFTPRLWLGLISHLSDLSWNSSDRASSTMKPTVKGKVFLWSALIISGNSIKLDSCIFSVANQNCQQRFQSLAFWTCRKGQAHSVVDIACCWCIVDIFGCCFIAPNHLHSTPSLAMLSPEIAQDGVA